MGKHTNPITVGDHIHIAVISSYSGNEWDNYGAIGRVTKITKNGFYVRNKRYSTRETKFFAYRTMQVTWPEDGLWYQVWLKRHHGLFLTARWIKLNV